MAERGSAGSGGAAASLRRLAAAAEGFAAQLQCAICLCAYTSPTSLPCNHCFCEECIHRALELKPECPICKAPATKRRLRFDTMIAQLLRATGLLSAPVGAGGASGSARLEAEEKLPAPAATFRGAVVGAPARARANGKAKAARPAVPPAVEREQPPPPPANEAREQLQLNGPFAVGQLVDIVSRTWVGVNKPGGAARVTKVNGDHTYNVKYVLDSRRERKVPDCYLHNPSAELAADVTPSRAVKQRQRRTTTYATRDTPSSDEEEDARSPPSGKPSGGAGNNSSGGKASGKRKRSEMVLLCSGFDAKGTNEIEKWSELLGAEIVASWTNRVTHLVVKCVVGEKTSSDADASGEQAGGGAGGRSGASGKRQLFGDTRAVQRWVKIRSMKYLKALVGGRWIVSEEWLQACAVGGTRVSEADFEADGHLKGRNIDDAPRRSRKRRQENLLKLASDADPDAVGTQLFATFCFHLVGDFLPPMPPQSELDTLLTIGGGTRVRLLDDAAAKLAKAENRHRQLVVVSDRINPVGLRDLAKYLKALPQLASIADVAIVNYQWVLNSISEAKLRPLK
ncbi:hypothetical protein PybrP1_008679 [[Pythium] brassicae (nom. inval.)]|nr:hypothetical protein PybrP1_008679 [[Pythium] brassicae (nom. inval.)]